MSDKTDITDIPDIPDRTLNQYWQVLLIQKINFGKRTGPVKTKMVPRTGQTGSAVNKAKRF